MSKIKEDFLKDVNFSVPIDVFKKELMKKPNGEKVTKRQYKNISKEFQLLQEQVFPILLEGIEQLAKEVELLIESKNDIDIEVRQRFNPCLFLGQQQFNHVYNFRQYLMRNNPKYQHK